MKNEKIDIFFDKHKKVILIVLVVILLINGILVLTSLKTNVFGKADNSVYPSKENKTNNNDQVLDNDETKQNDKENNSSNSKNGNYILTLDDYFTDNVKKMDNYEEIKELFKKVNIFSLDSNLYYSGFGARIKDLYGNSLSINYDNFKKYGYYMALGLLSYDSNNKYGLRKEQVSVDELNSKLEYIFGKEYVLQNYGSPRYYLGDVCYDYDSDKKVYYSTQDCDFTGGFSINSLTLIKVYDSIKTNDGVSLYLSVLYKDTVNNIYYKDEYYDSNSGKANFKSEVSECQSDENQEACYKSGNLYKFVYTKENNSYVFSNVEKIN